MIIPFCSWKHCSLRLFGRAALIVSILLTGAAAHREACAAPPRPNAPAPRHGREIQVIDGNWRFHTDPGQRGELQGWTKTPPSDTTMLRVPSLWSSSGSPNYSGTAWYWREFDVPSRWKGQTLRLRFEAVADHAAVWLNGEKLGEHTDGATPFEFNITKNAHVGATNLLAVRVEGAADTGAGIWQGVLLMAHDEAYIADVFAYAGGVGNLIAEIRLLNTSDHGGDADLDARLVSVKTPDKEIKKTQQNLSLTSNLNVTTLLMNVPKKKIVLWSPGTPSLYYLQLAFHQEKDVLDTTETTVGFREFGWQNGTITLNGIPVSVTTSAPQLSLPVVIATEEDRNAARALLQKMKQNGITVLYLDAPPPTLLTLADEEGLLIVEGARPSLRGEEAANQILQLITRDRSHPSILAWNLRDTGEKAIEQAHKLDSTRFLLAQSGKEAHLWPPHSEVTAPVSPPSGLLAK
jgi:beta-galactosidase